MTHRDSLAPKLKALGHSTRLTMVRLLLADSLCVGALAARLGLSEAAVSQHLRILREAGLVKGEKQGYWTHYTVQTGELQRLGRDLSAMPENDAVFPDLREREFDPGQGEANRTKRR